MKLLHIDSSILTGNSVSRALTAQTVQSWLSRNPETVVEYLDLGAQAPDHLSADALGFRAPANTQGVSPAQAQQNAVSERLVSQFLSADVVVIGVPLYNFSIPSQLKAWVDRVLQPGRTFKYTEAGPQGLAGNKTVILALTRGGVYSSSDGGRAMEHQESYLKTVFGFIGVTDIRLVRAEGLAMGESAKSAALAGAEVEINRLTAIAANEPREAKAA